MAGHREMDESPVDEPREPRRGSRRTDAGDPETEGSRLRRLPDRRKEQAPGEGEEEQRQWYGKLWDHLETVMKKWERAIGEEEKEAQDREALKTLAWVRSQVDKEPVKDGCRETWRKLEEYTQICWKEVEKAVRQAEERCRTKRKEERRMEEWNEKRMRKVERGLKELKTARKIGSKEAELADEILEEIIEMEKWGDRRTGPGSTPEHARYKKDCKRCSESLEKRNGRGPKKNGGHENARRKEAQRRRDEGKRGAGKKGKPSRIQTRVLRQKRGLPTNLELTHSPTTIEWEEEEDMDGANSQTGSERDYESAEDEEAELGETLGQLLSEQVQRELPQVREEADPAMCPSCGKSFRGKRGVRTHQQRTEACKEQAGMLPMMIPPSVLATGLFGISRVKKGVEKGLDEIRKGVRKGLDEIEGGVKKGLKENKKELEKLEKEGKKERERARKERMRTIPEESDEEETVVMAPLITKNQTAHYQPWTHSDVNGLISRLPVLHEGAGRWISRLESETQGRNLAVGDIKYLLGLILGKADTEAVLERVKLERLMDISMDALCFDGYRNRVWKALREAYPNQYSPSAVWIEKLKDSDNPAAFVEKAAQEWTIRMEQRPEDSGPLTMQFRRAVMDALPKEVRTQLESDWRLAAMPKEEFRLAVVHHVTLYRQGKEKEEQQEKEAIRKLTHVQLQEAKGAKKAATQAPVMPATALSSRATTTSGTATNNAATYGATTSDDATTTYAAHGANMATSALWTPATTATETTMVSTKGQRRIPPGKRRTRQRRLWKRTIPRSAGSRKRHPMLDVWRNGTHLQGLPDKNRRPGQPRRTGKSRANVRRKLCSPTRESPAADAGTLWPSLPLRGKLELTRPRKPRGGSVPRPDKGG
ncbi:hypothetical protein AALO_G00033820 [Alosa alosa]|uniref:C2H2-type domain-containing protein n=1 Tax=Alosa alosa TaxID=278164 RepID=A0AAV6HCR7_9TELE|nr:hypothetical protein AALO_G00033820 [Alosa alosa]